MANYIPNHEKKIRIRQEKEEQLCRLISRGVNESKLIAAAAVVKEARIRELRAKRAQVHPADTPARTQQLARIDGQIQRLHETEPESVLAEFRDSK